MSFITWGGLVSLFVAFFMIGIGAESKSKEKRGDLVFFGFAVLMLSVLFLGAVVLSTTLSGTDT